MSSSAPPIPPDQQSAGAAGSDAADTQGLEDRRDRMTAAQSAQPGDADVNTDEQGRFGNIAQNTTHQGYQQDR